MNRKTFLHFYFENYPHSLKPRPDDWADEASVDRFGELVIDN